MGRKFRGDMAQRRADKHRERERALAEAHADALAADPEFVAESEEIDRQLRDGTFDPGPGLDVEELRRRYG